MDGSTSTAPSQMEEKKTLISCELPGFRFHPTEEELLEFYLKNIVLGNNSHQHFSNVIGFLNIYRHDPQDLPRLAKMGEREWYFFVPRDRKQSNGGRLNRTTKLGFWKATGSDRKVVTLSDPKRVIGYRKTLVFYQGRAPRGTRTDWVMNEYRLPHYPYLPNDDVVLCKVYRKATSLKVLEQWAAKDEQHQAEEADNHNAAMTIDSVSAPQPLHADADQSSSSSSICPDYNFTAAVGQQQESIVTTTNYLPQPQPRPRPSKREETEMDLLGLFDELAAGDLNGDQCYKLGGGGLQQRSRQSSSLTLPFRHDQLPELQVPKLEMEPFQDPLWSSWLDHFLISPFTPTAELLTF